MDLQLPKVTFMTERDPLELQFEDSASTASTSARSSKVEEEKFDFLNYKPKFSAQEFQERVCGKLDQIYQSYEESAQRYEAVIKNNQKTIRTCNEGNAKADRQKRIDTRNLNEGF